MSLHPICQPSRTVVKASTTMSDAELVCLCQSGDAYAFDLLMKRHENLITGMLRKLAPNWNDTADLAQECFIRVWKGIKNLQNPNAFKSWMCQIVTHLFYDELRKPSRRQPALSIDHSALDDGDEQSNTTRDIQDLSAGPEEQLLLKESQLIVGQAMQSLPEYFRTAVMLRDLEDRTYEDIAYITQTDIGTVKSRISRGRSKVQKLLPADFCEARKRTA